MKSMKMLFTVFIVVLFMPIVVHAGSIRFNTPEKLSPTSYRFTLTIQDMDLNFVSGSISITNGTISKIEMANGWVNQTGNNTSFYFYRDGVMSGNYTIATIYVTMTGNSEYSISNANYGVNKCKKDIYGIYFGDTGSVVSESVFRSVCGKSKDATLKSLSLSSGTLSPSFSPSLETYSAVVENHISAIVFSPVVNHNKAKVITSTNCALKVGLNTCKLVVQAESGDTKTYSVTVIRKGSNNGSVSSDASINNLKVNGGTLTTLFSSSRTEYDVKVAKNINQLTFSFTMNSNGQKMTSGPCSITPDTAKCKLTITAEDGVSTRMYTFNILHEESSIGETNNSNSNTNASSGNAITNSNGSSNLENGNINSNNSSGNFVTPSVDSDSISSVKPEVNDKNFDESENIEKSSEDKEDLKDPKENSVIIPIVDKEVSVRHLYFITAIVTLVFGVVVGFILSKILKKFMKNHK